MSAVELTPENISLETSFFMENDSKIDNLFDEKIQNIWSSVVPVFALIGSLIATTLAFTVSAWFWVPAVPLLLASGILFMYGSSPVLPTQELGKTEPIQEPLIAETAPSESEKPSHPLSQPKGDIWEQLSASLNQSEFESTYSAHVDLLDLNSLIDFYEKSIATFKETPFEVPQPSQWRAKLEEETEHFNHPILTSQFSLTRLITYSLITPGELKGSFTDFANEAPLDLLISEYENLSMQLRKHPEYSLPPLSSWKDKLGDVPNFQNLTTTHSIPSLIRHSLLDAPSLTKSFNEYAQSLTLLELIDEYEKTSNQVQLFPNFSFPFLQDWKDKFKTETANLKASEIEPKLHYPRTKLLNLGIVNQAQYQVLKQIGDVRDQYLQLESRAEKETLERISKNRDQAKKLSDKIPDSLLKDQKNLFSQYLKKVQKADAAAQVQIESEELRLSLYKKAHPHMTKDEETHYKLLEKKCEEACLKTRAALEKKKKSYHDENLEIQQKIEEALQIAYKTRAESLAIADSEYESAMKNFPKILSERLSAARLDMERRISDFDLQFKKLSLR